MYHKSLTRLKKLSGMKLTESEMFSETMPEKSNHFAVGSQKSRIGMLLSDFKRQHPSEAGNVDAAWAFVKHEMDRMGDMGYSRADFDEEIQRLRDRRRWNDVEEGMTDECSMHPDLEEGYASHFYADDDDMSPAELAMMKRREEQYQQEKKTRESKKPEELGEYDERELKMGGDVDSMLAQFKRKAEIMHANPDSFDLPEWDKLQAMYDHLLEKGVDPRELDQSSGEMEEAVTDEDFLKVRGYDAAPPPEAHEPPEVHGMDHTQGKCCAHGQMPGECDVCCPHGEDPEGCEHCAGGEEGCPHGVAAEFECPDCGAELELRLKKDHMGGKPNFDRADDMGADDMVKIADHEFYTPYFESLEESMEEDYDMNYPLLNKKLDIWGYDFKGRGDFPAHYVPAKGADNPMKDIIDYGKGKAITEGLRVRYERFKKHNKRV